MCEAFGESKPPRQAGAYESGGKPPFDSAQDRPHSKDLLACCDDCCGEGCFFVGEDCAQVEDQAIVFDAGNHGWAGGGFAKAVFERGWGELR